MMDGIVLFVTCVILSIVVINLSINFALSRNITDDPGEHKMHDVNTPFVGGVGVFSALCVALVVLVNAYPELMAQWIALGVCSAIIYITGLVDDFFQLGYKSRLIIQAIAGLLMISIGQLFIDDLGGLLFGFSLQLGPFSAPFTILAIICGINALNMIDGIDGLLGAISLATLFLIGVVALISGDIHNVVLVTALAGGVAGFLYFNLRHPGQSSARVFLGDNGSMLIGFIVALLLIDLSQGDNPAMKPVVAIWLLAIPLMDIVSVMHRRMRLGKSPFTPDHNHLHHILLSAGFRVEEVVFVMAILHLLLGIIGITAFYLGVPEFIMLLGFLLAYFAYFSLTLRPWRFVPILRRIHTRMGLTVTANRGVFLGDYITKDAERLVSIISKELGADLNYWVKIFEQHPTNNISGKRYAVALNVRLPKDAESLDEEIIQAVELLQEKLEQQQGIYLRQFVSRDYDNADRRKNKRRSTTGETRADDRRNSDRRALNRRISDQHRLGSQVLAFEVTHGMPRCPVMTGILP